MLQFVKKEIVINATGCFCLVTLHLFDLKTSYRLHF